METGCAWLPPQGNVRVKARLTDALHPRMADVQHGWWFPERKEAEPELFGVFESNANVVCPDGPEFCSSEIGGWPLELNERGVASPIYESREAARRALAGG
jgi:hypothetical protein